jgi:hypothetical protein
MVELSTFDACLFEAKCDCLVRKFEVMLLSTESLFLGGRNQDAVSQQHGCRIVEVA